MTSSPEARAEDASLVLDASDTSSTRLVLATRAVADRVRGARLTAAHAGQLADELEAIAAQLEVAGYDDDMGPLTLDPGSKGAGQPLAPVYEVADTRHDGLSGTVRFPRMYLGAQGAVHGGALALWADDVLGRLSRVLTGTLTRTAFLHVDYRAVVPVDRPLAFTARAEEPEGRKRRLRATLAVDGLVAVEAHGLWITPRPE